MRKLGNTPPFRPIQPDSPFELADSVLCERLLRFSLFIRLADQVVCQLQNRAANSELGNTECTFLTSSTSSILIDHLSVLSGILHQITLVQLNVNPLLSLFTLPTASADPLAILSSNARLQMDMNSWQVPQFSLVLSIRTGVA